ncbi:MAG: site-specific integrase [Actinobacteria bacterium]|nr:site-specific integrase [Actinomycetota bacterium]
MKVNGNGSWRKLGKNRWEVTYSCGKDAITGHYIKKSRTFHGTKQEAMTEAEKFKRELENGMFFDTKDVTLSEYIDQLVTRKLALKQWALTTCDTYKRVTKNHIKPYIGDMKLSAISPAIIDGFYSKLAGDYETRTGRSSQNIVAEAHKQLNTTLACAAKTEYILSNPCDRVDKPKKQTPVHHILTLKELNRLFLVSEISDYTESQVSDTTRLMQNKSCIMATQIAAATGMRKEEVLGLLWEHINFEEHTLRVEQVRNRFEVKEPKTKSSKREIVLDARTNERLKAHKALQCQTLLEKGIAQTGKTYVLTNSVNEPLGYDNLSRWFRTFCKKYGFGITFHELRHTQATHLLANTNDTKAVSDRLGHSNTAITQRMYEQSQPDQGKKMATLFESLISQESDSENKQVISLKAV